MQVLEVKEEAAGLLNARHIVLCRLNNMAVRAAHQLLSARPHQQWALLMLQCSEELSATWSPALLGNWRVRACVCARGRRDERYCGGRTRPLRPGSDRARQARSSRLSHQQQPRGALLRLPTTVWHVAESFQGRTGGKEGSGTNRCLV